MRMGQLLKAGFDANVTMMANQYQQHYSLACRY